MPEINVTGGDTVARTLKDLSGRALSSIVEAVWQSELIVEGEAKRRCPVGVSRPGYTGGRLRASIAADDPTVRGDLVVGIVGTNVEYAPFVEYGTGQRGAASNVEHPGEYVYGPKPGMSAHPYLRPALDENANEIQKILAAGIRDAIRRSGT